MEKKISKTLPVVYSCSGCSSSAQMANWIAVQLDRRGIAEMSCIAGIGGGVGSLVRKAQSAGSIIGIDGCAVSCVKHCLAKEGLEADIHYNLSDFGVEKKCHMDFDAKEAEEILSKIISKINICRNTDKIPGV